MKLEVFSEIGRLRAVLVHAPGPEVDSMPPSMMDELLFDDIIYGPRAREEHARFRAILERFGAAVLDAEDLLVEALAAGSGEAAALVRGVVALEGTDGETAEWLGSLPPAELARALIHGVPVPPEELTPEDMFQLAPLPNLLFTRDPQVVLGEGVVVGAMSRRARRREPLLSRFIFEHHPEFRGVTVYLDCCRPAPSGRWPRHVTPTLEGGDVLVLREGLLLAGVSERTMEKAADRLAEAMRALGLFRKLILVPMPRARSSMHLDTIFTRLSEDECLVYGPMILPGGPETLSVITVDLGSASDWGRREPSLLDALRKEGVELEPVSCGGREDTIQQAREQWTDGANSFAIAPGAVMIYSRNVRTAEELARRGYEVVSVAAMAFGPGGECLHDFAAGRKVAILVAGEELSRARGGPRCMTMPLRRDPV